VGIGLFYILCSYAWVYGAGFDNFVTQSGETANPWRALATVFWGSGWVLVFFAIVNSALANANAGVNAGTRVIYAMARNGVLPAIFARTHPRFRTPHVAIVLNVFGGLIVALLLGWKWDPITAFTIIAVTITIVVIVIYMAVCLGSIVYYWTQKREEFSIWLHGVFPVLGAVAFAFPLYYQYNPLPDYPIRYANWAAIGWLVLGVLVLVWLERTRPEALENADRIYVEDETLAPATGAAPAPAAR
jgi:amino acid transporter